MARRIGTGLLAVGLLVAGEAATPQQEACAEAGACGAEDEASLLQLRARDSSATAIPEVQKILAKLRAHSSSWLPTTLPEDVERFEAIGKNCSTSDEKTPGCPFSRMNRANLYNVYPGGRTACLDSSAPYFFQVKPGDPEKLYIHFQGGGACWDKLSYEADVCKKYPMLTSWSGLLNWTDARNPYRDYTMVKIMYCSGDLHAGNTTANWTGETLQVRGVYNTMSALTWALDNFPSLRKLRLVGASAGSLGLQLWIKRVLRDFSNRGADTVIIPDSFMGVLFPPSAVQESETTLWKIWNICGSDVLDARQKQLCVDDELLISDMFVENLKDNPQIPFGMIYSKADVVEWLFAKLYECTAGNKVGADMTFDQFYKELNLGLQRYIKQPNFQAYLVDDGWHVFTSLPVLYKATPYSFAGWVPGKPLLIDWVDGLKINSRKPVVCLGHLVDVKADQPAPKSLCYCDSNLQIEREPTL